MVVDKTLSRLLAVIGKLLLCFSNEDFFLQRKKVRLSFWTHFVGCMWTWKIMMWCKKILITLF